MKKKLICSFAAILLAFLFFNCEDKGEIQSELLPPFLNYRDIPGVTDEEIIAIEALRENYDFFGYSMMPYSDAFLDRNGEIAGFAVRVSDWFTKLFDIPFIPYHINFQELNEGLESGEVDFNGSMLLTEERRQRFFMTDAIARRTVKHLRLLGSEPLSEIAKTRTLQYAFLAGGALLAGLPSLMTEDFEIIIVDEYI
ncbi:MAG: transporter substrate-binding domain-containing protein, partial [Treponema sp.]|nr:transporter substrate-binding domain-containing protein [Treponema sp.]